MKANHGRAASWRAWPRAWWRTWRDPWYLYSLALFASPGLINHAAIFWRDYEFNLRNLMNLRPGLAYDLGHGVAPVLAGILLRPFLPTPILALLGGILYIFLLFYHYIDYCYYTEFLTHIPVYVLSYTNQAGNFSASLFHYLTNPGFFLQVVLPLAGFGWWFYQLRGKHGLRARPEIPGWARSWRETGPRLVLVILIFLIGNSYGNSYDGKINENPLHYNIFRYLKISADTHRILHGNAERPDALIRKWPVLTRPYKYWFFAGNKEYPLQRRQPRVLCGGNREWLSQGNPKLAAGGDWSLNLTNPRAREINRVVCPRQVPDPLSLSKGEVSGNEPPGDAPTGKEEDPLQPAGQPPNVLFLLLENFRAEDTGVLGGQTGQTPYFDQLTRRGILFDHFFANGSRTKDAMVSVYCSILPIPFYHMMRVYRDNHFQCLPAELKTAGYATAWLHNGDANFDFRTGFFRRHGFDHIWDKYKMPFLSKSTGWGYSDADLMRFTLKKIKTLKSPWFVSLLTITPHHPYEAPAKFQSKGAFTDYERYRDTIRYSDQALKIFMEGFFQTPAADNTIIFITGDHGNHLDLPVKEDDPAKWHSKRARVPLLILLPGLDKPLRQSQTGTLLDLAPTLFDLLGWDRQNHWFGMSAFLSDNRKLNMTYIDRKYAAFNRPGRPWFALNNQHLNPSTVTEKKQASLDFIADKLQVLDKYLLQENKFAPAGSGP